MLWVDHLEIRLLLSRIKAVWGAMRQVRVVVAIVMVHEVKEMRKTVPCDEFIREKKGSRAEKKKRGRRRGRRGRETESRSKGEEKRTVRFSYVNAFILFIFLFSHRPRGRSIHPLSLSLPAPIDIDKCDSTDRNPSSPITNCPNESISTNKAW